MRKREIDIIVFTVLRWIDDISDKEGKHCREYLSDEDIENIRKKKLNERFIHHHSI